jgi:hypothetical protein
VCVTLVDLGVEEDLLDGFKSAAEETLAELLETCTGDGNTLVDRINFDGSLSCGRKNALDTLASGEETMELHRGHEYSTRGPFSSA